MKWAARITCVLQSLIAFWRIWRVARPGRRSDTVTTRSEAQQKVLRDSREACVSALAFRQNKSAARRLLLVYRRWGKQRRFGMLAHLHLYLAAAFAHGTKEPFRLSRTQKLVA